MTILVTIMLMALLDKWWQFQEVDHRLIMLVFFSGCRLKPTRYQMVMLRIRLKLVANILSCHQNFNMCHQHRCNVFLSFQSWQQIEVFVWIFLRDCPKQYTYLRHFIGFLIKFDFEWPRKYFHISNERVSGKSFLRQFSRRSFSSSSVKNYSRTSLGRLTGPPVDTDLTRPFRRPFWVNSILEYWYLAKYQENNFEN